MSEVVSATEFVPAAVSPVYVIVTHQGWGESTDIEAVFSSQELAEQYLIAEGYKHDEDGYWCSSYAYIALGAEREHKTFARIQEHQVRS